MNVVVYEDERVERLSPITIGRPAYAISCGSYQLLDWIDHLALPWSGVVRPHLRALQQADHHASPEIPTDDGTLFVINARLVPSTLTLEMLCAMKDAPQPSAAWCNESIAAAIIPAEWLGDAKSGTPQSLQLRKALASEQVAALPRVDAEVSLFEYAHDIVRHNMRILPANLEYRLRHGDYQQVANGVFAAEGARLGQFIVSDTREGPIVLEAGASVGPYTYLSGPVYLGRASRVIEHSAIKDGVSIGHTTKVGGEVEASVIEAYTNKQHHGFLGHSYLGSWINLGAGTCNSDLKNTYGEVKMEYGGRKVQTGMQFIGCIIGDYSKTAINTSIFTGKTIGVCSMLYGFVTTNVPSFVNYARSFGQVTELPSDVMVATQQRMFARRSVTQRECDMQLMRDMYELTIHERQLAGEPLSL